MVVKLGHVNILSKTNMKKLPIAMVERESGISKDALRVWERRYGFPTPERDDHGDRHYDESQVEKLKLIKKLIGIGHRPAKMVLLSAPELSALLSNDTTAEERENSPLAEEVIGILRAANHTGLIAALTQKLASDGLKQFVIEELAPLNGAIGQAWAQGKISIAQEHLYTEAIQRILRAYLQNLRTNQASPKVLLATLPGEQHGLGLLMVECVISVAGSTAISLGTEVPINEIAVAAQSHHCDAVAISFSRARTASFVTQGVKGIRELLDEKKELWIGGDGAAWLRQPLAGVLHLSNLRAVLDWTESWNSSDHPNRVNPFG